MKRARRRIGIYESSAAPSGPSRYVDSLLAALDPDEYEATVFGRLAGPYAGRAGVTFVPVNDPGPSPAHAIPRLPGREPAQPPCRHWRSLTPGWLRLWCGFGRESLRLAERFRRRPVDLLHANDTGCEEAAVAARLAGVPRVLGTFHVDSTYDLDRQRSGGRYRILEGVSNHCLDAAIAVSRVTGRDWVRRTRLPADRVVTIPNGIDPDRFARRLDRSAARRQLGLPDDGRLIVGGIGRLDFAKGFEYLLQAVARLHNRHPNVVVALAGRGPELPALAELGGRLGIAGRVHFLGFRTDVQPVLDALDVFVLSSVCEALPYALLEAMATELPAVGTRVGGVPEVIVSGVTGYLAPARNPGALAAALHPLLNSAQLRQRMGRAGRERVVRHFHVKDMAHRTIEVYRRLLGRRPAERRRAC